MEPYDVPHDGPYDVIVVGGGPCGATAAHVLATQGFSVALLDREGRIKPCGGAIPPRLIHDFDIPDHLIKAKVTTGRVISPTDKEVDMPITGGFVGMVDREEFDPWLRQRAAAAGADWIKGTFDTFSRDEAGVATITYRPKGGDKMETLKGRFVIGADGARSRIGKQTVKASEKIKSVFAYHEIVRAPDPDDAKPRYGARRCDVYYDGRFSPDFYSWVFPHGETMSIGTGSAHKGFSLRNSVSRLREATGLDHLEMVRHEGAPLPLKPAKKWDNGRDVVLAGDAAGVVAPASGEGIYYAMLCGQLAAEAVELALVTGRASALAQARKRFMKEHGKVFFILGLLQRFWYTTDKRREQFVKICRDPEVQRQTWEAYMNKKLVKSSSKEKFRIMMKDISHLLGFAKT
ncbi:MAG: geranylgeranyl diphosphate reductase [Alphaproteobacteria bacterium]|nr:geranylgeranyl diphosphate reductase [Alphaproteobacteria bacterium]